MKISVSEQSDFAVARLDGNVEENAKQAFDDVLHPLVLDGKKLLLDLSGVERMTSAGIGHLVTLVSRANTKGTTVVLAAPTPFVKSVLNATKLTRFFDLEDSVEAGAARLRSLD